MKKIKFEHIPFKMNLYIKFSQCRKTLPPPLQQPLHTYFSEKFKIVSVNQIMWTKYDLCGLVWFGQSLYVMIMLDASKLLSNFTIHIYCFLLAWRLKNTSWRLKNLHLHLKVSHVKYLSSLFKSRMGLKYLWFNNMRKIFKIDRLT